MPSGNSYLYLQQRTPGGRKNLDKSLQNPMDLNQQLLLCASDSLIIQLMNEFNLIVTHFSPKQRLVLIL